MPFLGKLFRKKRKRKHSTSVAEEAINNLRDIEALLLKKQEHYEEKIATVAFRNIVFDFTAIFISTLQVLVKVEAQRTALEDAGMNMEVLGVLSQTTNALRIANQKFDLDKV
ncbi:hypothetical protein Angca_007683, partial [Angiostrongylus cantonensis]